MALNNQPAEKQVMSDGAFLDIHSVFTTIQGEGPFAGRPSIFIRLAGCNLQCPMCDTEYTATRRTVPIQSIVDSVVFLDEGKDHLVVITGGEPFRQNINQLCIMLVALGYNVQIETNGTLYQSLPWDLITVVCSPKTGSLNPKLIPHIAALKYVIHANSVSPLDGLPLRALNHPNSGMVARPPRHFSGIIYVQPVDDHVSSFGVSPWNKRHLEAAIDSCMKFGYHLGLQLHKYINLP